jgi:predicted phosphodiesterase
MKYAIISDIHANPAALEKVLADSVRYGVGKIVCAGDLVGYGPDPILVFWIAKRISRAISGPRTDGDITST